MSQPLSDSTPRPFTTLASRIGFFVFAATLAGAVAVAGTSALALRAFLRNQTEARIVETAVAARDRLAIWHQQRLLDVEVFSKSELVVAGLARSSRGGRPARGSAREEVEQYLQYVRDGLPVYSAIFALDRAGRTIASVGDRVELAAGSAARLAPTAEPTFAGLLPDSKGRPALVVSAPVGPAGAAGFASLHALIPVAELEAQMRIAVGDSQGRIHLYDERDRLIASSVANFQGGVAAEIVAPRGGTAVAYSASDGVRVVASGLPFTQLHGRLVFERDYGSAFAAVASILVRTATLNFGIALVFALLAFATARSMLRPLRLLSQCAVRLRDGETDVDLPVVRADHEIGTLARSFGEMVQSLTRANEVLGQLAITDGLTKIHNHRHFQDQLALVTAQVDRTGAPLALILLDIDDFKALNDRFGHAGGDAVLERLGHLLNAHARPTDVLARYGGEEFALLARDTTLDQAVTLAEQIRMAVHDEVFFDRDGRSTIRITISVGVSAYRGDRIRFFQSADQALYAAKHAGKDCVLLSGESD